MAEGGGVEEERRARQVRRMCPHPPRPFKAYSGPPLDEGELVATFPALQLCSAESEEYLQQVKAKNNNRIMFRVDCAFDPYSEQWVTASVDLHVLRFESDLVSLNNGPLAFMTRTSLTDGERIVIPYRRSKRSASTVFFPDGSRIAWSGYTRFCVFDRCQGVRRVVPCFDRVLCGAVSPVGSFLALLSSVEERLYLRILNADSLKIVAAGYCPPEVFTQRHPASLFVNNPLHLLWSRCGRFLGLSTYHRKLVIFKADRMIECQSTINIPLPTLASHRVSWKIANPRAFDFASCESGTTVAVGTIHNTIFIYKVGCNSLGLLVNEADVGSRERGSVINCLQFSHDQSLLAVALGNGTIELMDNDSLLPLRSLPAVKFAAHMPRREPFFRGFSSLAFACSDNFLAAGATDGEVRVWCLRRPTGPLKALCRTAIRSHCKFEDLCDLPLSPKLRFYLTEVAF